MIRPCLWSRRRSNALCLCIAVSLLIRLLEYITRSSLSFGKTCVFVGPRLSNLGAVQVSGCPLACQRLGNKLTSRSSIPEWLNKMVGTSRADGFQKDPWDDVDFVDYLMNLENQELLIHVVAAFLSSWIYDQDESENHEKTPSLRGSRSQIDFTVHNIFAEPPFGISVQLAAITAVFPGSRKVMFLVFKGTSRVTDLIADASITPNYGPFLRAFVNSTSFVHQGAYHGIQQIAIRGSSLCELLMQEEADGVNELVVAGHSLGGMYAKAFMLETFIQSKDSKYAGRDSFFRNLFTGMMNRLGRKKSMGRLIESGLIQSARCVTFGAPAICGAYHPDGAELPQDLVSFMRTRAINYVHENDPCPRAWSHLDIEKFVEAIAHQRLDRFLRGVPFGVKGVTKKFLVGLIMSKVSKLVDQGDFRKHVVETAKHYQELSKVRLLTRAEYRDWTILDTFEGLQDHTMSEYISCLRDATYASDGHARVFGESGDQIEWS